jgi:hypothetical protein
MPSLRRHHTLRIAIQKAIQLIPTALQSLHQNRLNGNRLKKNGLKKNGLKKNGLNGNGLNGNVVKN